MPIVTQSIIKESDVRLNPYTYYVIPRDSGVVQEGYRWVRLPNMIYLDSEFNAVTINEIKTLLSNRYTVVIPSSILEIDVEGWHHTAAALSGFAYSYQKELHIA